MSRRKTQACLSLETKVTPRSGDCALVAADLPFDLPVDRTRESIAQNLKSKGRTRHRKSDARWGAEDDCLGLGFSMGTHLAGKSGFLINENRNYEPMPAQAFAICRRRCKYVVRAKNPELLV